MNLARRFLCHRLAILLATTVAPSVVFAGTLTTALPDINSGRGIYMNLTAGGTDLSISGFDTFFGAAVESSISVDVYFRSGSYVGFTRSSTGWTFSERVNLTAQGGTALSSIDLTAPLSIAAGQTLAVYLHSLGGIRYSGSNFSPPVTTWSNSDLTLYSNDANGGASPFGPLYFTPRTFSGNVNYLLDSPVPEPGTVALLGLGLLFFAVRRRMNPSR